jgi:alginate O-acetyltransferase complex protein AlgI
LQFNSYVFAAFLAVVLAVYNLPALHWRGQKLWLLVTSYLFYAAWDPVFVVLVWLSTFVDWTAARLITNASTRSRKRVLLIVSVIVNLGVLGYFKYGNFVLANVVSGLHAIGVDYQPAALTSSCRSESRSTRFTRCPTRSTSISDERGRGTAFSTSRCT